MVPLPYCRRSSRSTATACRSGFLLRFTMPRFLPALHRLTLPLFATCCLQTALVLPTPASPPYHLPRLLYYLSAAVTHVLHCTACCAYLLRVVLYRHRGLVARACWIPAVSCCLLPASSLLWNSFVLPAVPTWSFSTFTTDVRSTADCAFSFLLYRIFWFRSAAACLALHCRYPATRHIRSTTCLRVMVSCSRLLPLRFWFNIYAYTSAGRFRYAYMRGSAVHWFTAHTSYWTSCTLPWVVWLSPDTRLVTAAALPFCRTYRCLRRFTCRFLPPAFGSRLLPLPACCLTAAACRCAVLRFTKFYCVLDFLLRMLPIFVRLLPTCVTTYTCVPHYLPRIRSYRGFACLLPATPYATPAAATCVRSRLMPVAFLYALHLTARVPAVRWITPNAAAAFCVCLRFCYPHLVVTCRSTCLCHYRFSHNNMPCLPAAAHCLPTLPAVHRLPPPLRTTPGTVTFSCVLPALPYAVPVCQRHTFCVCLFFCRARTWVLRTYMHRRYAVLQQRITAFSFRTPSFCRTPTRATYSSATGHRSCLWISYSLCAAAACCSLRSAAPILRSTHLVSAPFHCFC